MIVINIRGTGGSGKSTLVRSIVGLYPEHAHVMAEKRRQPLAGCHWFKDARRLDGSGLYEERPNSLFVPGHYATACGGCDTIKTVDQVYEMVRAASLGDGNNVLYEGIMVMDDVTRAVALDADLKKAGHQLLVVYLNTPIEDCLAGIRARREAGGNEKPLNEKNTRDRMKRQEKILLRLEEAGVQVLRLDREQALVAVTGLLLDGREPERVQVTVEETTCPDFLSYITERQATHERRESFPKGPWTRDGILRAKKFCCVIRDDDRTSREARKIIQGLPEALRMRVMLSFRLYNRVDTLRALLEADSWEAPAVLRTLEGLEVVFNTQAYRVTVKGGLWNLPTISGMIARIYRKAPSFEPRDRAQYCVEQLRGQLELGPFVAYQTMQDIRWLGHCYRDEDTWCLIGGGALRGLQRLDGTYSAVEQEKMRTKKGGRDNQLSFVITDKQQDILLQRYYSQLMELLAQARGAVDGMNMFEVEHNLCEWDKYERIRTGETPGLSWRPRT